MIKNKVYDLLEQKYKEYNKPFFIDNDPVQIPHRFSKKQDIEIAGFFAATLAWGQRVTIIRNTNRILEWMDESPHDFILHHKEKDLKRFLGFVHRTFNDTDLLYFIEFFKWFYSTYESLEEAFTASLNKKAVHTESALVGFFLARRSSAANEKACLLSYQKVYLQASEYVPEMDGAQG